MKFDSQSQYHHSYPAHEHDAKVILHDNNPFILAKDDHFMIDTLNLHKEALKEGRHGFTSPIERKSSRVAEEWEQYLDMEYSTNINNIGDETVLKENFYTDKTVTKVEVPERRVCIEDDHHNVKDINMDKGVQSCDKSLVQEEVKDIEESCPAQSSTSNLNLDNGHNDSTDKMTGSSGAYDLKYTVFESSISILDQDQVDPTSVHKDLVGKATENPADETSSFHNDSDGKHSIDSKGDLDSTESILGNIPAEVTESSAVPVPDVHNYCHEKGSLVSSIDCGGKLDASESAVHNISSDVIEDQVLQSSVVPVPDVHNHCDEKCSPVSSIDCGNKLDAYKSAVHNMSFDAIEDLVLPSQEITTASLQVDLSCQALRNDQKQSLDVATLQEDLLRDSNSASRALSFPSEVSALSNESKEIPASGVITFNFDTEAASTSGRNEKEETANSQQAVVAQNGFQTEEGILDAPSSSSRYSFLHLMEGESSLSGPSILSGPIANSGHIPFSGNISLRSDSSTTSARSFAFPILQSEWNSSPVKMAKAERRKHRGWKMGLLCCRF